MRPSARAFKRVSLSVPIGLILFLASCAVINPGYELPDICKIYDETPVTPLAAPDPNDPAYPKTIFEAAGQFKVMHGYGAAKIDGGGRIIKVEQSVPIPSYANQAAVFLNGWKLTYLSGDHHVVTVGAAIGKISLDRRNLRLNWEAAGLMRDDDFNDGYEFKYYYTVIAWASGALDLRLDQGRPDVLCNPDTNLPDKSFAALNADTTTALSSFSVFSQDPGNSSDNPVAVLPRGFAFAWYGGDHHLYQLGYDLGHSEIFAEQGKTYRNNKNKAQTAGDLMGGMPAPLPSPASRVDSGFVSWDTSAIFKDNSTRRDYIFGEAVSTLSGSQIGLVQPPFSILPSSGQTSGLISGGGVITRDVVIENVPFAYAIPVLTGWDLAYISDDQHVKEVGIWIEDWSYAPGLAGTLKYKLSSVLRDKDSVPGHSSRHEITILGIRPAAGQPGAPVQQSPQR